jgi:hypothetical protein
MQVARAGDTEVRRPAVVSYDIPLLRDLPSVKPRHGRVVRA